MSSSPRILRSGRPLWAATRAVPGFTVLLGIAYPLVITGIAQVMRTAP
ncbi:K+-transporting ATPase c subunit [Geodermatophilus bullaregiensis]|nr:hypothetical protein [Geodermatophilus bullaregiensis]MBM7805004.1 K+-transporting ATPase c subunit [Geodermatophilus bullaregiensis]